MEVSRSDAFAQTIRISRREIDIYYVLIFMIVFSVRTIRSREFAPEVMPLPTVVSTHEVYPTNCSSSIRDPRQLNRSGTINMLILVILCVSLRIHV